MKMCNHCKTDKELVDFGKDIYSRDGINPKCKLCCREFQKARKEEKRLYDKEYRSINSEELKASDRLRYAKDPEKSRGYKLETKFGLSLAEEQHMLEAQQGACAVCLKPEWVEVKGKIKRLAVDHNKITGKVRGLLCNNCNRALGMLYESISTIENLLVYVKRDQGA